MKVKCEQCKSEFNLNDSLLKKEGSTVRCSVCKNVFKVFPPEPEIFEPPVDEDFSDTVMEETVALDLPPDLEEIGEEPIKEDSRDLFDRSFKEAMEEVTEDEDFLASDDKSIQDKDEDTDESPGTDEADVTKKRERGKGKSRLLLVVLSIVGLIIIAFLINHFFFPGAMLDSFFSANVETEPGNTSLDFEKDVAGKYVESSKAGKLFVISGFIINNYTKNRSYILVKGGIQAKDGKQLKEETAYAGNALTDDKLKEMTKEEIKNNMKNRAGANNINVDVKPGSHVPFMIIITDLPDKDTMTGSYLTVEAVSSSANK